MSALDDKLALIDAALRVNMPYDASRDRQRASIVIVVGKNDVHRFNLDLQKVHEYEKILISPRRREKHVMVYLLLSAEVGNSGVYDVSYLNWPYRWLRKGTNWDLLFPAAKKLPRVPVKGIPDEPWQKPVKIGPKSELSYRGLSTHLERLRIAVQKQFGQRRRDKRIWSPFPKFQRPTSETINWAGWFGRDGPNNAPWVESPWPSLRYYRSFSSVNTPGFRSMRKGRLPVNPYSLTRIKIEDPMGHYKLTLKNPDYAGTEYNSREYAPASQRLGYTLPAAPTHEGKAYDQALKRCISRAGLGINANVAQDLAQVGQLTRMMGDSIHRLAAGITNVKHHDFKGAWEALTTPTAKSRGLGYRVSGEGHRQTSKASVLPLDFRVDMRKNVDLDLGRVVSPAKSVAENWLALQYGWKPLLHDIDGAIRSLADAMSGDPIVIRTAKSSGRVVNKTKSGLGITSHHYQETGMVEVTKYSYCKIGFRYTVDSNLKQFLAQTGFTNPINLAWEVLPYSFVVDWFLPIGPYLETLSAFDGLAFLDGYVTKATWEYTSAYHDYVGKFPWASSTKLEMDIKYRLWREYLQINRTKLWSFPDPVVPTFKNPFSVTHALNGLALLRAAFA